MGRKKTCVTTHIYFDLWEIISKEATERRMTKAALLNYYIEKGMACSGTLTLK